MLTPLVLPEGLVGAVVVWPVCVHVAEQFRVRLLNDGGDVGVLPALVTKLLVCAIAVIRPETVNGERVLGASARVMNVSKCCEASMSKTHVKSQNWTCRSCPPGALKQHVFCTAVLFWHDSCELLLIGHESDGAMLASADAPIMAVPRARLCRRDGIVRSDSTRHSKEGNKGLAMEDGDGKRTELSG